MVAPPRLHNPIMNMEYFALSDHSGIIYEVVHQVSYQIIKVHAHRGFIVLPYWDTMQLCMLWVLLYWSFTVWPRLRSFQYGYRPMTVHTYADFIVLPNTKNSRLQDNVTE